MTGSFLLYLKVRQSLSFFFISHNFSTMTIKKSIFILIILAVLILGCLTGFIFGRGGKSISPGKQADSIQASASPCPSLQTKPPLLSEATQKVLSDRENFKAGLAEAYKSVPLYPGISENDVWTFLKPLEGIFYISSSSRAESVSFYETKLKEAKWTAETPDEAAVGVTHLIFVKDAKKLNVFVDDKTPDFLPKELGLKQGTFISLHFSP